MGEEGGEGARVREEGGVLIWVQLLLVVAAARGAFGHLSRVIALLGLLPLLCDVSQYDDAGMMKWALAGSTASRGTALSRGKERRQRPKRTSVASSPSAPATLAPSARACAAPSRIALSHDICAAPAVAPLKRAARQSPVVPQVSAIAVTVV